MANDFDIESLIHVEQTFYDTGYQDGFAHGRIHGLIEGRALGREKGFEMWEELGYYEGFTLMWDAIYKQQQQPDSRALNHIRHLLDLISQFPRSNPSAESDTASDLDIPKLFRQIRSRYKALCATLGVRPSLRASETGDTAVNRDELLLSEESAAAPQKENNNNVWDISVDETKSTKLPQRGLQQQTLTF